MPSRSLAAGVAAGFVLLATTMAGPAGAHVTITPPTVEAGEWSVVTLEVGHGCGDFATTRLEVKVPEQLLTLTPTRSVYWGVETTEIDLEEPVTDEHGNTFNTRVDTVVFTAAEVLPSGLRDTVELAFTAPETPGEVLTFPTLQTCEESEQAWVQVPQDDQDPATLDWPAPQVEVVAAAPSGTDRTTAIVAWAGLGAGLLGMLLGALAFAHSRR